MASLPPATRARRLDVEGLRGIAVLLVVCFHAGIPLFSGAFVAVDVFFVLSGFFLATTLARRIATGEALALSDLYARRIWRLLPALVIVLLATLASVMWLYAPIDRELVAGHMLPVSFFASNLAFAATGVNYFQAGENPLIHTWTLGVEWQLALLLPLFVAFLAAYGARRAEEAPAADRRERAMRSAFTGIVIVGAISFALAVILNEVAPMWAYFGPHTRLWAFAAGAGMAFFAGGGQSVVGQPGWRVALAQLVGLALIFIPALLYTGSIVYPGLISLAPVAGTVLLLGGGSRATVTWIGRLLSSSMPRSLGAVSYSWYLWHWPMMVLGGVLFPTLGPWGTLLWGLAAIFPARATQRVVDGTIREMVMPKVINNRPLVWAASVSAAMVLIAFWASSSSRAYVANSEHRVFAAARADRMAGSCWANREIGDSWGDGCAFGDTKSATTFALLGDSHAEHWLGGLDRAGKENGWRIQSHVMGACPAADFTGLLDGDRARWFEACLKYRDETIERVIKERPAAVILSSADHYFNALNGEFKDYRVSPEVWTRATRTAYKRLADAGLTVIVLRDVPLVPFDVPTCLSRRADRLLFSTDCTFEIDQSFVAQARLAQNVAAFGLDVRFVDMNDQVCTASPCATMRDGLVVYTDDDHITSNFARSLGGVLGQRIATAFSSGGPTKLERLAGKAADIVVTVRGLQRSLAPLNR